jgi:hypothetical protein
MMVPNNLFPPSANLKHTNAHMAIIKELQYKNLLYNSEVT